MIERDKEYYNKKIGELYAIIENQEKIIRELQDRNSKAIKYIKTTNILGLRYGKTIFSIYLTKLLEILKGGNNEKKNR